MAEDLVTQDMLESIFNGQEELIQRYHNTEAMNGEVVVEPEMFGQLNDRAVQIRLKTLAGRVTEELYEAMHELKNRPWKRTETPTDQAKFDEELMDALHFFVELLITAGFDAVEVYDGYFRKHRTNRERQETGY